MKKKKIFTIIAVLVITVCIGIKTFAKSTDFILKDENYYIIELNEAFTNLDNYNDYYEADFNNNKVILRRDNERYKRVKRATLNDENCEKLKKLIKEITNKKENEKEILEEEKHILYRKNIKYYYTIKTFDNKVYYVKDNDDIEKMQEILEEN